MLHGELLQWRGNDKHPSCLGTTSGSCEHVIPMLSRTNNGPNRFRVVRVITNSTPVLFSGGRLAELTRMQSPCKRWQPCETLRWSDQTSGGRLADCLCWPELDCTLSHTTFRTMPSKQCSAAEGSPNELVCNHRANTGSSVAHFVGVIKPAAEGSLFVCTGLSWDCNLSHTTFRTMSRS